MGLFQSIFKPKVTDRAAGSGYRFPFGQSSSGKAVNERTAMQMTAVYAAVRILAEGVASLPLHVYRRGENGDRSKAEDMNLFYLLHDKPNPEMTSFIFREALMCHLLLFGNAYAQVLRNGRGEVAALYPLLPNKMSVERDEKGQLFYRYIRNDSEQPTMQGNTVILMPSEVLHIPGLGFDGLVGYSPISMTKNAIGLGLAAEEYGSRFFANGAAPAGVLEHPGVIKDVSKLRESWNETFGGSRNAGKVAILEEGLHFNPISMSPQDSQLLETRQFQLTEIARIFRIPPHMLGDLSKATFAASLIQRRSVLIPVMRSPTGAVCKRAMVNETAAFPWRSAPASASRTPLIRPFGAPSPRGRQGCGSLRYTVFRSPSSLSLRLHLLSPPAAPEGPLGG